MGEPASCSGEVGTQLLARVSGLAALACDAVPECDAVSLSSENRVDPPWQRGDAPPGG